LSYDPADSLNPINTRYAGDTLAEGMFLIRPMLGDVDLGGVQAAEGNYSRTWKQRLREELQNSPENLCLMLRNKGLDLVHLRSCLSNWTKPATGVIHAPQLMEHFRILIEVLAPDRRVLISNNVPWWQLAWREIRVSRGEAIHAGFQEQQILQEQTQRLLRTLISDVRLKASASDGFHLLIPTGRDIQGTFLFWKVLAVEEGFHAPETELKEVRELSVLEEWRTQ
jgi:hypothetical protein